MSKLDQLKALGDAKRAARKGSGRGMNAHQAPKGAARETSQRVKPAVEVAIHRPEAKRGRGRPKVEGPRPWEVAGVSRATWHRRRQKEQKND